MGVFSEHNVVVRTYREKSMGCKGKGGQEGEGKGRERKGQRKEEWKGESGERGIPALLFPHFEPCNQSLHQSIH